MSTTAPAPLPLDEHVQRAMGPVQGLDARVQALVREAATGGGRHALAAIASGILTTARLSMPPALQAATLAVYLLAADAVRLLLERPGMPLPAGGDQVAARGVALIDRALKLAERNAVQAIRDVTADNLDDQLVAAVTARVAAGTGARWPIEAYARMVVTTSTTRAVNAGTADMLTVVGHTKVKVSSHGSRHPFCRVMEGREIGVDAQLPPWHAGCKHFVAPTGFTTDQHAKALDRAGRR